MSLPRRILRFTRRFFASDDKQKLAKAAVLRVIPGILPKYPLQIVDGERGFGFVIDGSKTAELAREKIAPVWTSGRHLIDWAVYCLGRDSHSASRAARKWLSESFGGASVTIIEQREKAFLRASLAPTAAISIDDKFEIARQMARRTLRYGGDEAVKGETLTGGVVQYLCLRERYQEALEFLETVSSHGLPYFLSMMRTAIELRTHGPVPKYIDQLLGADGNYFKGRFCSKPFEDFEVTPTGAAYICCPNYLPEQIGNIKQSGASNIINSQMATRIRRSILEGKFSYCDWTKCKAIKNEVLPTIETARADPLTQKFIDAADGRIDGPKDVRLSYDSTCNLSCPSCRSEKIVAKGKEFDEIMWVTDTVVRPLLRTAETVMMNGYGDIFSSRSCRRILETMSLETHPRLKFKFITNGVLLTESEWAKFPNIHGMVDSVRVSIDAVKEETYDIVRRGGDFEKLKRNLLFMARLRKEGLIREFMISFVVQRQNFREMADFCRWGAELGCDYVIFEVVQNWNTFSDFAAEAVHLPSHPLHQEYQEEVAKVHAASASKKPNDRWRLSADFGYVIH